MYNQLLYSSIFFILSCASPSKSHISNNFTDLHFIETNNFSFKPPIANNTKSEKLKFLPNLIDQGLISETGLVLGNITYSIRIQTINSSSLLSMPKMKIEDEHLYIPNHTIITKPNRD